MEDKILVFGDQGLVEAIAHRDLRSACQPDSESGSF